MCLTDINTFIDNNKKSSNLLTNIEFRYIINIGIRYLYLEVYMGNKTLTYGNVDMLVLKLLENQDMYGYQITEQLEKQSQNVFSLSAGSLYPLLHNLEVKDYVETYEADSDIKTSGKRRKYYH